MKNVTNQAVRAAIDDCLSGVESMPSVRVQVLNQVRGEVKVKKKLSLGIVFAMLLTVLMAGAALAARLGLFGQIGERENSDARLPALERVAESVGASFTTTTTYYQDETGLYLYYGDCPAAVWHPFTVKKDTTGGQQLVGESAGEGWTAQATLTASAIDIKGELILSCPQDWVEIERTWENPKGLNYIGEWHVYMDGVRDKDGGVEWVSSGVDGQLTFGLCCKVDAAVTTIQLVPVYSKTGESMAEAITLKIAE